MSDLETHVQPILEPMIRGRQRTVILTPDDQAVLSQWVFKTMLVAEWALPSHAKDVRLPQQWYADFYRNRVPPEGQAIIWTTAYRGGRKAAHARRRHVAYLVPDPDKTKGAETHAFLFTLTAFCAVFQMLAYFGGEWRPTGDEGAETQRFLIRLHPRTGSIAFWPKGLLALDDFDMDNFSLREDFR